MASTEGMPTKNRMVERLRTAMPVQWTYKSTGGRRWVSDKIKGWTYIVKPGPPYTLNKVNTTKASVGAFSSLEQVLEFLEADYLRIQS